MLTKLFSSPVRVKILKLLVMQSGRVWNATDIARATGAVIRSVNKEITKLVEAGAVLEEIKETEVSGKKVRMKHYRANQQFIIFAEIKNIFLKLQVISLDELKGKAERLGAVNYLALTGRFVGNTGVKIDLLVVGRANRFKLEKFIRELERRVGWEVNWAHMDLAEYDYRRHIGDLFLSEILDGNKIEVYSKFV